MTDFADHSTNICEPNQAFNLPYHSDDTVSTSAGGPLLAESLTGRSLCSQSRALAESTIRSGRSATWHVPCFRLTVVCCAQSVNFPAGAAVIPIDSPLWRRYSRITPGFWSFLCLLICTTNAKP